MRNVIYLIIVVAVFSCTNQEKGLPNNFDFGKAENGLYTNDFFEMEIHFNQNWDIQDKQEMNDLIEIGTDAAIGDDANLKAAVKASQVNTAYLFTIFKYEVGAAVEFNPSFMVIAENTRKYPGVKNGKDYLFHAKKLLAKSQMEYYFEKELFEKRIGKSTFYVLEAKLDILDQTITQDYISTVTNGFSLSFVVSYTTEEDKKELYEIIDKIKI